jgi:hypothetical protein
MSTVYIETTIPSYLAALPSRDLVVAAHQQITHDWWLSSRPRYGLYISEAVMAEVRIGDPEAVERRLQLLAGLPILALSDDVRQLVHVYEQRLGLGPGGRADLPHIAFAVSYELDYLLTWNCRHIANGQVISRLLAVNAELRRPTPVIVTPEELLVVPGEDDP